MLRKLVRTTLGLLAAVALFLLTLEALLTLWPGLLPPSLGNHAFSKYGSFHTVKINRMFIDGVIEAPGGAHFTECPSDYGRDESFQKEYAATAKDPDAWEAFRAKYLDLESEAAYQEAVKNR